MLVFLALLQRINTQLHKALVNRTQFKNATLRAPLSGAEESVIVPEHVDGVASVLYDNYYGYNIRLPGNITVWAESIPGSYICGAGRSFRFGIEPNYLNVPKGDAAGSVLVVFIGLAIFTVISSTWPLLISVSSSIEVVIDLISMLFDSMHGLMEESFKARNTESLKSQEILHRLQKNKLESGLGQRGLSSQGREKIERDLAALEKRQADESETLRRTLVEEKETLDANQAKAKEDVQRKIEENEGSFCNKVKYVWMAIASVLVFAVGVMVGQLVCVQFGWPNLVTYSRAGACYFLDMTKLDSPEAGENSTSRRGLSGGEALPKAQVKMNPDGSVDFVTNCESSMYQSSTGAVWKLVPDTFVSCVDVRAGEVEWIKTSRSQTCGWAIVWDGNDAPVLPGSTGNWLMESMVTGGDCSSWMCPGCDIRWKERLNWKVNDEKNWQLCKISSRKAAMTRDGVESTDFTNALTVDPRTARSYGWYTDGDKEVIITTTFDSGRKTSILFGDALNEVDKVMRSYARRGSLSLEVTQPSALLTQPSNFECKMSFTLNNGGDYEEFRNYCKDVSATQLEDGHTTIRTTGSALCSLEVVYPTGSAQTISVSASNPVTILAVEKWRCASSGGGLGTDCGPNAALSDINAKPTSDKVSTEVVTTNISEALARGSDDSSGNPSLFARGKEALSDLLGKFGLGLSLETILIVVAVAGAAFGIFVLWKKRGRGGPAKQQAPKTKQGIPDENYGEYYIPHPPPV